MKYGQFVGAVADILEVIPYELMRDSAALLDPENQGKEELVVEDYGSFPQDDVDEHGAAKVIIAAISQTLMSDHQAIRWAHHKCYEDIKTVTRALRDRRPLRMIIETGAIELEAGIPLDKINEIRSLYEPGVRAALRAVN